MLDGQVCQSCFDKAVRTRGSCPRCGVERLLPGLSGTAPICRDCAGIKRRFICRRCGTEARLYYGKVCVRCRLHNLVPELLDDGTGTVPESLQPLIPVLAGGFTGPAQSRLTWLGQARTRELLTALATGTLELSHAALDALPNQARARYLRALLVTAGCLPAIDDALHRFQTWLHRRLTTLADHRYERVLRQFGTWHHLAKMRTKAERQPLTDNARTYAVLEINRAIDFCTWLTQHDIALDTLTQPALDCYYSTLAPAYQQSLRGFLNWAITSKRMPRLHFTRPRFRVGEALTQSQRLGLLRDLLTATDKPLAPRVAGCILLLYAQPIPRILALHLDDIIHINNEVLLRLGTPPTPVPEPFAALLLQLLHARQQAGGDDWLFTGRALGRPLCTRRLADHLRALGIPLRLARTAAVRELVLDVPAPVVAHALGFHHTTTHRHNTHAGGTWNRYITTRA